MYIDDYGVIKVAALGYVPALGTSLDETLRRLNNYAEPH